MFNKYFIIFVFVFLPAMLTAQTGNFRIYPSAITQTEPVIYISPVDRNIIFVSAVTINTSSSFKSEGIYVSTNGGYNWRGSDTCSGASLQNHGGDPGVIIDKNGVFIITHIGQIFTGVYSHYSTNLGANWSAAYTITSNQPEDKGTVTTDNSPSSPYYGRTYASWVNFVSPFPVLYSYSSNSGTSWTSPSSVNSPPPTRCSGGHIITGVDGKVYIVWTGVISSAPFTEDFAGFAVSSNGGANWTVNQNIFDMNGISGTLPQKGNIRVNGLPRIEIDNSGGPRNGWIYIVTNEISLLPAGSDPDIILRISSNGGANWSGGIRVNQDALSNGKIQYFPELDIDSAGAINILYYDDRNTTSDSAEVMLSRSTDGGNLWKEYVVSSHRFKPKPIAGGASGYQGDHISLLTSGSKLYALWMDDFSGIYQVWCSILDLNTIGIKNITTEIPDGYSLNQNYPNPFNPSTNINFSIPKQTFIRLTVYDILGREIAVLVNSQMNAGTYNTDWNASNASSGIYLYKIETNDFTDVKTMIVLK